jgi:hypothetical protein
MVTIEGPSSIEKSNNRKAIRARRRPAAPISEPELIIVRAAEGRNKRQIEFVISNLKSQICHFGQTRAKRLAGLRSAALNGQFAMASLQ